MSNFKIGDRVELIELYDHIPKGSQGKVKMVGYYIGVEFDENISGHAQGLPPLYTFHLVPGQGEFQGKYGYCWNVDPKVLVKVENSHLKIKWYSKGRFNDWKEDKGD